MLPTDGGATAKGVLAHEFYLWHDPRKRESPAGALADLRSQDEDLIVTAITDEKTGLVLKDPLFIASFTLETSRADTQ